MESYKWNLEWKNISKPYHYLIEIEKLFSKIRSTLFYEISLKLIIFFNFHNEVWGNQHVL